MKKALSLAVTLCKEFEGLFLKPYLCPAGVPTIGYGTTWKPDGTKVTLQDAPVTATQAELWLINQLAGTYLPAALKHSPNLVLNENALGAITDFVYNLGSARYKSSTLRKRINDEDWEEAEIEIMRWVRGGGRILPGLVRRRQQERKLL
jgi:lysozyme